MPNSPCQDSGARSRRDATPGEGGFVSQRGFDRRESKTALADPSHSVTTFMHQWIRNCDKRKGFRLFEHDRRAFRRPSKRVRSRIVEPSVRLGLLDSDTRLAPSW